MIRGCAELVAAFLREHGYAVGEAADVPSLRAALARARFDLIVLDLMMPGEDGLAALRTMERATRPPVIMLSAMGSDTDRIVGLEMGADDYLAKPCNPRELLARIRAVLRRETRSATRICDATQHLPRGLGAAGREHAGVSLTVYRRRSATPGSSASATLAASFGGSP